MSNRTRDLPAISIVPQPTTLHNKTIEKKHKLLNEISKPLNNVAENANFALPSRVTYLSFPFKE